MSDRPVTVLVVDDDPISRRLLVTAITALGHQVVDVDGGDAALAALDAAPGAVDVMLLDLVMPGTDGREVLARVRDDTRLDGLAVVVVSAVDDDGVIADAIRSGATDYLVKPFSGPVLRARVEASVAARRLRQREHDTVALVDVLAEAARAVDTATEVPDSLHELGTRPDQIGDLARLVLAMAEHVAERAARLEHQVAELRIELDQHRRRSAVAEISSSERYRRLRADATELRGLLDGGDRERRP